MPLKYIGGREAVRILQSPPPPQQADLELSQRQERPPGDHGAANLLFTPRLHADKVNLESLILVDRNLRWVILFSHQIVQQKMSLA
jgi:hypothetical protein